MKRFRGIRSFGVCAVLLSLVVPSSLATRAQADTQSGDFSQQIVGDLIGAGLSIGATLTGNVPLAFLSGFAAKYISTYGVGGVKKLINYFKGHDPQDLGEVNIYYIYLINVKRNLYGALIDIRKDVAADHSLSFLTNELDKVNGLLAERCNTPDGCNPGLINQDNVNFEFLNLALDAKRTIDVSKYLDVASVKDTYEYLMMLYMDVLIVEQKLIEAQYNILAARVEGTLKLLKDNAFLSQEEKELQAQMLYSIALRWIHMAENRRLIVAKAIEKPLEALETENQALIDEIEKYKRKQPGGGNKLQQKMLAFASFASAPQQAAPVDPYQAYLNRIADELKEAGTQIDANAQNPFQTGTALSGYFLSEKTLLLERDAYFDMKANKLATTDEVADFQHRISVLRSYGNNILLQLLQAVEKRNQEGFLEIEKPKQDADLEKLIADCAKDATCVANRLAHPETALPNIFIDNFALATQIFSQIPYMHVIEVNAIYQLVQLIQLEVFFAQNQVSQVEFNILFKEQKALVKAIDGNHDLSENERRLHRAMATNTLAKWKKRILTRRYDRTEEFKRDALSLNTENKALYAEIIDIRKKKGAVLDGIHESRGCFSWSEMGSRQWCNLKNDLYRDLDALGQGKLAFIGQKDQKLPDDFWKEL